MNKRKILIEICAALLVMMFLYAGLVKVLNFPKFVFDMNNQPLPNQFTPLLIAGVLCSELLIVVLLMFKRTRLKGFYLSAVVLAAFTIYITMIQLGAFDYVPCSCGGVIENFTWWQHFFFNVLFLVISLVGIFLERRIDAHNDPEPDLSAKYKSV